MIAYSQMEKQVSQRIEVKKESVATNNKATKKKTITKEKNKEKIK
jgi:hypothetical protein